MFSFHESILQTEETMHKGNNLCYCCLCFSFCRDELLPSLEVNCNTYLFERPSNRSALSPKNSLITCKPFPAGIVVFCSITTESTRKKCVFSSASDEGDRRHGNLWCEFVVVRGNSIYNIKQVRFIPRKTLCVL